MLSLSLEMRRELCAISHGYEWRALNRRNVPWAGWRFQEIAPDLDAVCAGLKLWLPVSPIAIALHAAKLAGRDKSHFVAVTVAPCHDFGASGAELATGKSWRDKANVVAEYVSPDDTAKDPTGHRAAIALLQKVMAEVKP